MDARNILSSTMMLLMIVVAILETKLSDSFPVMYHPRGSRQWIPPPRFVRRVAPSRRLHRQQPHKHQRSLSHHMSHYWTPDSYKQQSQQKSKQKIAQQKKSFPILPLRHPHQHNHLTLRPEYNGYIPNKNSKYESYNYPFQDLTKLKSLKNPSDIYSQEDDNNYNTGDKDKEVLQDISNNDDDSFIYEQYSLHVLPGNFGNKNVKNFENNQFQHQQDVGNIYSNEYEFNKQNTQYNDVPIIDEQNLDYQLRSNNQNEHHHEVPIDEQNQHYNNQNDVNNQNPQYNHEVQITDEQNYHYNNEHEAHNQNEQYHHVLSITDEQNQHYNNQPEVNNQNQQYYHEVPATDEPKLSLHNNQQIHDGVPINVELKHYHNQEQYEPALIEHKHHHNNDLHKQMILDNIFKNQVDSGSHNVQQDHQEATGNDNPEHQNYYDGGEDEAIDHPDPDHEDDHRGLVPLIADHIYKNLKLHAIDLQKKKPKYTQHIQRKSNMKSEDEEHDDLPETVDDNDNEFQDKVGHEHHEEVHYEPVVHWSHEKDGNVNHIVSGRQDKVEDERGRFSEFFWLGQPSEKARAHFHFKMYHDEKPIPIYYPHGKAE